MTSVKFYIPLFCSCACCSVLSSSHNLACDITMTEEGGGLVVFLIGALSFESRS